MFQATQRRATVGPAEDASMTFVPVAFEVVEPEEVIFVRPAPEGSLVSQSGPRVLFPDTADPTQTRRRSVPRPLVAAVVVVLGMLFSFLV